MPDYCSHAGIPAIMCKSAFSHSRRSWSTRIIPDQRHRDEQLNKSTVRQRSTLVAIDWLVVIRDIGDEGKLLRAITARELPVYTCNGCGTSKHFFTFWQCGNHRPPSAIQRLRTCLLSQASSSAHDPESTSHRVSNSEAISCSK